MISSIEKGDNLFELIFELDRRLQSSQNHSSPLLNLKNVFSYMETVLIAAMNTQPDVVETVFLKLVDFFIKCNCNYKRSFISEMLTLNPPWISVIKQNRLESIRRIVILWDQSILNDFETCLQILNFISSCSEIFYLQSISYGILFDAFDSFGSVSGFIFESSVINTTCSYLQKLFDLLNSELSLYSDVPNEIVSFSVLAATIIQKSIYYKNIENLKDPILKAKMYKIFILTSLIKGEECPSFLPIEIKETFKNLLIYFE